jgi:predicted TIM-barrel fold metal-dependent hydrolase
MRDRYTVISSDCHAGADLLDYRDHLESRYHEQFDEWAAAFVNPYADLAGDDADRNWHLRRRLDEQESEGIVGEVVFPNTIPPFFPSVSLAAPAPTADDLEVRWAGIRAHNRWLADFCGGSGGRLAGVGQILLNDVDAAVTEIHWIAEAGLRGGILLPGVPEESGLAPLYAEVYEPIWAVCAETGLPVNHHGGGGSPLPPLHHDAAGAVWVFETHWWAHRALWHLMFSGVLDRHPGLILVLTEQATGWIPQLLRGMDVATARFGDAGSALARFAGKTAGSLPLKPSEYWARQCYVGASFLRPIECELRHEIGVDRIMWGSDYPHSEGTWPHSREALRLTFAGVPEDEVRLMLGGNAARVYGFDIDALDDLAATVGPTVEEVAIPLDAIPAGASSAAFAPEPIRTW